VERAVGVEPEDLERFLAEDAESYVELGFTQFTLGVNGPAWAIGDAVEAWLAWRDRMNAGRGAVSAGAPAREAR
jgi:hypothetical protein